MMITDSQHDEVSSRFKSTCMTDFQV